MDRAATVTTMESSLNITERRFSRTPSNRSSMELDFLGRAMHQSNEAAHLYTTVTIEIPWRNSTMRKIVVVSPRMDRLLDNTDVMISDVPILLNTMISTGSPTAVKLQIIQILPLLYRNNERTSLVRLRIESCLSAFFFFFPFSKPQTTQCGLFVRAVSEIMFSLCNRIKRRARTSLDLNRVETLD